MSNGEDVVPPEAPPVPDDPIADATSTAGAPREPEENGNAAPTAALSNIVLEYRDTVGPLTADVKVDLGAARPYTIFINGRWFNFAGTTADGRPLYASA